MQETAGLEREDARATGWFVLLGSHTFHAQRFQDARSIMVRIKETTYVGFKTRHQSDKQSRDETYVKASTFPEFGDLFLHDAGGIIFAFLDLSEMPTILATSKRMRDLVQRRAKELLATTEFLTKSPYNVPIEKLPMLTKLVFKSVRGKHVIEQLSRAISSGGVGSLTELYMTGSINGNKHMKTLCHISDEGLKILSSSVVMKKMGSLVSLGLSTNSIGNEGMKAFSSAIKTGALTSLSVLCLRDNKIGDAGMIAFAKVVMPTYEFPKGYLPNLKELNLGYNNISDLGMRFLSDSISTGALGKLKELSLFANKITDHGLISFVDAIMPIPPYLLFAAKLPNLTRLLLWGNEISVLGAECFMRAILRGALENLEITDFRQILGRTRLEIRE